MWKRISAGGGNKTSAESVSRSPRSLLHLTSSDDCSRDGHCMYFLLVPRLAGPFPIGGCCCDRVFVPHAAAFLLLCVLFPDSDCHDSVPWLALRPKSEIRHLIRTSPAFV